MWEAGGRKRTWDCFRQPPTFNWHKISWINCLFFCLYVVCSLKKEDFLENLHVLSCFVQLESVLLISCVFWILFQNAGSQLCFRFFFFFFYSYAEAVWWGFHSLVCYDPIREKRFSFWQPAINSNMKEDTTVRGMMQQFKDRSWQ